MADFEKTMTPGRWQQIKEALDAVLELPPPERGAYLQRHYGDDPALQREVQALLEADDAAESFLEEPAKDYARTLVQMNDRPAEDPLIGEVLDSYRVLEVIGRGGMGIVYRARDLELNRIVAIKMIDPALARDKSFVRRFRSEAQEMARINSRNIVSVYALRKTERGLFLAMECIEGGTVSDLISDGPLSYDEALPIIEQMMLAFEAAHGASIVHRDIKPGNVMVTEDGVVKVTDFGLAKRFQGEGVSMATMTQGIAGTLHYMSPEQVQGLSDLDHRSDLYSAGMTIYQMLTGRLPIDRDSSEFEVMRSIVESELPPPSHFRADLSPEIDRVVMRSLEKDPDDRYQSASEMREAFLALGGDAVYQNGRTRTRHETGPGTWPSETDEAGTGAGKRWAIIGGVVGVVLAALVIAFVLMQPPGEPEVRTGRLTFPPIPADAIVYVDGERIADDEPLEVPAGEAVTVRVEREGYESWSEEVTLEAGEIRPLPVTFEEATPSTGMLTISASPSDAVIRVDGERVADDEPLEVPAGEAVTVRVEREGYESWSEEVTLEAGEEHALPVTLEREPESTPMGTLVLTAPSGGTVAVAGQTRQGSGTFRVPAGRHQVIFSHPQYGDWTTSVDVRANGSQRLAAFFEKQVNIAVSAEDESYISAALFVNGSERGTAPRQMTLGRGEHTISVSKYEYTVEGGAQTITIEPYLSEPGSDLATERVMFRLQRQ